MTIKAKILKQDGFELYQKFNVTNKAGKSIGEGKITGFESDFDGGTEFATIEVQVTDPAFHADLLDSGCKYSSMGVTV